MRRMLAAWLLAWAIAPQAQAVRIGVGVAPSDGGGLIAFGYGTMPLAYEEAGTKINATGSGWYLAWGGWLGRYFALEARLGGGDAGQGGAVGPYTATSIRVPSFFGVYLRPTWPMEMMSVHALVGLTQLRYELTTVDPVQTVTYYATVERPSFGAGIALAPTDGVEIGAEWLVMMRGASLGSGPFAGLAKGSASLISGYLMLSY